MAATVIDNVPGLDPRLDVNSRKQRTNVVPLGASNLSYQKTTSNNVSNSNVTFNVAVPNARTYVPRVVYLNVQGNTVLTGNSGAAGQPFLQCAGLPHAAGVSVGTANLFGPRCDPINQIIQQLQININGQMVSSNTGQYAMLLQRFNNERDEREYDLSMSPMMPDNSLNYSDDEMSNTSPLRSAQYNTWQLPRGCFPQVTVTANTSTGTAADTATVYWNFTTPIILSPFCYSRNYQEKLAFVQLTQLEFQFTLGGKGQNALAGLSGGLWSWTNSQFFPNPPTIVGAATTIQTAVLYNQFLYPPDWQSIPPSIFYAYSVPTWLANQQAPVAAGASAILVSQAIQRGTTPGDIILTVGEYQANFDMTKSDVSNFAITAVTLQWDSGAPALSTLSQYDLYQSLYVTKGGNMSWREWSGAVGAGPVAPAAYDAAVGQSGTGVKGSYIRIIPGIDIPLPPGDAPSCADQKHTLLFTVTVTNLSNRTITPSVNVLILDQGVFKIDKTIASQQSNLITPAEVKEVERSGNTPVPYYAPSSLLGGSFFSDVGQFLKRVARTGINIAKQVAPAQYQPLVHEADVLAKANGVGMNGYGLGLGKVKGGRRMSKRELMDAY